MLCLICNSPFTSLGMGKPQLYCSSQCRYKAHYRRHHVPRPKPHWTVLFEAKILRTDGCWIWSGSTDRGGYGVFGHRNRWSVSFRESNEIRAHRISWVLVNGQIAKGVWVLHKCDNPPCVNPSHLFLGTNTENSLDRDLKGRHRGGKGERCKQTHLRESDVLFMRELWKSGNWTQAELGIVFHLNQGSVSEIVRGLSWRHIL